jgi:hypothetical protein
MRSPAIMIVVACFAEGTILRAGEMMIDRCSGDVSFPPTYDEGPGALGAYQVTRGNKSASGWSPIVFVKPSESGRIRWWCHSTSGNWLDAGSWRIDRVDVGAKCDEFGCTASQDLSLSPVDINGWTAERSRCDNHTGSIRALLGEISQQPRISIQCKRCSVAVYTAPGR